MSVTEIAGGAIGEWSIALSANTPQDILDQIDYWGHIAVTSSEVDATRYGDALLDDARYVGVLRARQFRAGDKQIGGGGLSLWIGDEDDKGDVIEDEISIVDQDFTTAITDLIPSTVTAGDIYAQSGLHNNRYKLTGRRAAINYLAELYGAEWRVRGKVKFDIGRPEQLYPTEPTCAIIRNVPGGGIDTDGLRALPGNPELEADMEDFSTRVVTVGEGNGLTVAVGTADIEPEKNPYRDLLGNELKMVRLVSEQNTSLINANPRAQLQLNRFTSPREAIKLSTATHDIKGDLLCGGYVWVEDPEAKLVGLDTLNFKGLRLHPVKLRVSELSWPVEAGMGVAYRHWNGTWINLTKYVQFESGDTTVAVNAYNRALTTGTTPNDPIAGQVGSADTSTPDIPDWVVPFTTSSYRSEIDGLSRAEFYLKWETPLNVGSGTVVEDGSHYDIRYRRV